MKTIVYMRTEAIGFLGSLAQILADHNDVTIVADTEGVAKAIRDVFGPLEIPMIVRADRVASIDLGDPVEQARVREERYGEPMSRVMSTDRALGKGYLINAELHPDMPRAWWSFEEKLDTTVKEFIFFEELIEEEDPDLILVKAPAKHLALVARHHGIPYYGMTLARIGSRWMWVENEYEESLALERWIQRYMKDPPGDVDSFEPDVVEAVVHANPPEPRHGRWSSSLLDAVRRLPDALEKWVYHKVKGTTPDYYPLPGWVRTHLMRPRYYNYLCEHGYQPAEFEDRRLVYFPLHFEPESSLIVLSPEFNNSIEAISWLSKSLPADALLVVKEHPGSYARRPIRYYENLRRMPNVVLADPRPHSWDWIQAADLTAVFTGTAGHESVFFEKPVLTFSKRNVLRCLPTVRHANSPEATQEAVEELINFDDAESLRRAGHALYRALQDVSYESDFERLFERKPCPDLASPALENLQEIHLKDRDIL